MRSLGVYLHIPFCVRKCAYCDFLSFSDVAYERQRDYVDALCAEIASYGDVSSSYIVDTVFIGGGTPSVLQEGWITKIMEALRDRFCVSERAEITIEVNPGTLDAGKAAEYRRNGINRMSFGLQSADTKELRMLGRIHNYDQFIASFKTAREAGFKNINVDLMMGLPYQTVSGLSATIEKVLKINPEHISLYSLQVEEGTPIAENAELLAHLPSEETDRSMYHFAKKVLAPMGFMRYEISNYAKHGYECRHNMVYWTGGEYLGMGLGASSYMNHVRYDNIRDLDTYLQMMQTGNPIKVHTNHVPDTEKSRMEEYMFLGLRTAEGISRAEFAERFRKSVDSVYGSIIEDYEAQGLLAESDGRVTLTDRGIDVSNTILASFIL